jgi:hypothetical protein
MKKHVLAILNGVGKTVNNSSDAHLAHELADEGFIKANFSRDEKRGEVTEAKIVELTSKGERLKTFLEAPKS